MLVKTILLVFKMVNIDKYFGPLEKFHGLQLHFSFCLEQTTGKDYLCYCLVNEPFPLSLVYQGKDLLYLEMDVPRPSCNVTIVTAYYRMRSKHSNEEYLSWMSNFLTLRDCMVIFTQQDFVSIVQSLRPAMYQNQTIIKSIELNQEYDDHHIISGI